MKKSIRLLSICLLGGLVLSGAVPPAHSLVGLTVNVIEAPAGYVTVLPDSSTWRFAMCVSGEPMDYSMEVLMSDGKWNKLTGFYLEKPKGGQTCPYADSSNPVAFLYEEMYPGTYSYRLKTKRLGVQPSADLNFRVEVVANGSAMGIPSGGTDSRFYHQCVGKKCKYGTVLRVENNGWLTGVSVQKNEWFCLEGYLSQGKYMFVQNDYSTYPDFGQYSRVKYKGNYTNLKISKSRAFGKTKWSKGKKHIDDDKLRTLKSYYYTCATQNHNWPAP